MPLAVIHPAFFKTGKDLAFLCPKVGFFLAGELIVFPQLFPVVIDSFCHFLAIACVFVYAISHHIGSFHCFIECLLSVGGKFHGKGERLVQSRPVALYCFLASDTPCPVAAAMKACTNALPPIVAGQFACRP